MRAMPILMLLSVLACDGMMPACWEAGMTRYISIRYGESVSYRFIAVGNTKTPGSSPAGKGGERILGITLIVYVSTGDLSIVRTLYHIVLSLSSLSEALR